MLGANLGQLFYRDVSVMKGFGGIRLPRQETGNVLIDFTDEWAVANLCSQQRYNACYVMSDGTLHHIKFSMNHNDIKLWT